MMFRTLRWTAVTACAAALLAPFAEADPARSGIEARGNKAGAAPAATSGGGRIILDQPVKAGGLQLFPIVGEPDSYLYAPMTPRLARDGQGRPQFSFLRFVENEEATGSEDTPEEGRGGGILHAVVSLDVPESQLARARSELKRERPEADIVGAAIYSRGTLALVSTFQEENEDLVEQLVGLGSAPVLEGAKASVSIELTKRGAEVLWESFQMPTPDIAFKFEMALPGYWSPAKGRIVADLDEVARHETMQLAAATPIFEFEMNKAFDELQESKAIDVLIVGDVGQDKKDSMFKQAEQQIRDLLFNPKSRIETAATAAMAAAGKKKETKSKNQDSLLKRAQAIQQANLQVRKDRKEAEIAQAEADRLEAIAVEKEKALAEAEERFRETQLAKAPMEGDLKSLAEQTQQLEGKQKDHAKALEKAQSDLAAEQKKPEPNAERIAALEKAQQEAQKQNDETAAALAKAKQDSAGLTQEIKSLPLGDLEQAIADAKTEAETARKNAEKAAGEARKAAAKDIGEEQAEFVGYMTYSLKESHRTGHYEYKLDKYSNGELPLRFDGNIGDMNQYLSDERYFRRANLDDPLYKQREVEVYVDGMNSEHFDKFINFVTVQLRKQHQNGEITLDEVRIDRNNFNREGNRFRMLYGWKGDDDRDAWLEYEWRAVWSFFGGQDVEEPWQTSIASGIRAAPPYQIRSVSLEADPENMDDVRSTTVRLYYDLGGQEQVEQVTLRTSRPEDFSRPIEFMLPTGEFEYGYDISWRLRGNRSLSAPRSSTNESILYVDELPVAE